MLLRGTDSQEARKLALIGIAFFACSVLVTGLFYAISSTRSKSGENIVLTIDTPYIGQGVIAGTALVLHGVEVGTVTGVSSRSEGGVRLAIELAGNKTAGLTDSFEIDYRPANYFGVTAVNLTAGRGGGPLHDGQRLDKTPQGNFTMQALLSRVGDVSGGTFTDRFIHVVDKVTRYTDGLTPLIETGLIAANAVAQVQNTPTAVLLQNTAGIAEGLPPFVSGALDAGQGYFGTEAATVPEGVYTGTMLPTLDVVSGSLFGKVGHLVGDYKQPLSPGTELIGVLAGVVPTVLGNADIGGASAELRRRLENLFGGTSDERALQLRIVLDRLPVLAAPFGVTCAPTTECAGRR